MSTPRNGKQPAMNDVSSFIIVKRNRDFQDVGVFTGRLCLVDSDRMLTTTVPLVRGEAEISEHIEHAFVFRDPWQAWRWADRLEPDLSLGPNLRVMTWDVRAGLEFHPGEVVGWGRIARPSFLISPDQIAAESYARGLQDGERRAVAA